MTKLGKEVVDAVLERKKKKKKGARGFRKGAFMANVPPPPAIGWEAKLSNIENLMLGDVYSHAQAHLLAQVEVARQLGRIADLLEAEVIPPLGFRERK